MDSIFDIIGDAWGIHNERNRKKVQFDADTAYFSQFYDGRDSQGSNHLFPLFIRSRVKRDLDTHQKMIVWRFVINLNNPIDVEIVQDSIF
jgi:hypothetical protein